MEAVRNAETEPAFEVEFIAGWADEPQLAEAFAEKLWPVWAEACATNRSLAALASFCAASASFMRDCPTYTFAMPWFTFATALSTSVSCG